MPEQTMPAPLSGERGLLFAILAIALVLRLMTSNGIMGADDTTIADHALRLLNQGFSVPDSHYSSRIGLIFPQALVFRLFGVGEFQMTLVPLFFSLLGVLMAFAIGRELAGPGVGLLAAALLAVFPLDTYYATVLVPDLPLGATLGLSFWLALRTESSSHPWLTPHRRCRSARQRG